MNYLYAILLGTIQGLAEFLPISSSGHLVLVQNLLPNFSQPGVLFDVALHLGSIAAVLVFYYKNLLHLSGKYIFLLIIASVPAAIIGFLFNDFFEELFKSTRLVGAALIVTALFNYLTHISSTKKDTISPFNALVIGIAQAFAIIPGISRSGTTIMAGSRLGLDKKTAAQFSFLLSVPAIGGAALLQVAKHGLPESALLPFYFFGFVSSALAAYFSIKLVLGSLHQKKFIYFSVYTAFIGLIALLF